MVVAGLPLKFATMVRLLTTTILPSRELWAERLSSMPTPPTQLFMDFFQHEKLAKIQPLQTSVQCTCALSWNFRCSCRQTTDIRFSSASTVSSPIFSMELSERMLKVDTTVFILHIKRLPVADLSTPTWLITGGRGPCLSGRGPSKYVGKFAVFIKSMFC